MDKSFEFISPEKFTGFKIRRFGQIPTIKKHQYLILDQPITGEAPKNFIKHYEYGIGRKINPLSWDSFIAKTGDKWYPNESITEQLLTCLGRSLGFNMADSKLRIIGNQIRFLSRYFLKPEQQLIHGADIYFGYFDNDQDFVNNIENQNEARNLLTLQLTAKAIEKIFPDQHIQIVNQLIKMLLFDAWVGNKDRHFYNWGIISSIKNKHKPYFSPIYDTARALFWNYSEKKVVTLLRNPNELNKALNRYSQNSKPKIGWEGEGDINHFKLFKLIYDNEFGISKTEVKDFFNTNKFQLCVDILDVGFSDLMSKSRICLIKQVLKFRHEKIIEIIN